MHGYNIIIYEHQKEKIKKRVRLNFEEEFLKNFTGKTSFAKTFRNEINLLVDHLYMEGVQFYGFIVHMLDLEENDPELWDRVHYNVEHYISDIGTRIELIEFCYLSINIEKGYNDENEKKLLKIIEIKKNIPYLKGIIGVRTLIGENDFLDLEVKKVFRNIYEVHDIEINRINNLYDIKNYWNFVINNNNFRFHRFTQYSDSDNYLDIYGSISDLELIYSEDNISPGFAFGLDEWRFSETRKIKGLKLKYSNYKTIIIYLLNLYFMEKKMILSKNYIYEEAINTKYSYKKVGDIKNLKDNIIYIFQELKNLYPMHLSDNNMIKFIFDDWNSTIDLIEQNNNYLSNVIFNKYAIEFKDGIYFINKKKFFSFKKKNFEITKEMQKTKILMYFDIKYISLRIPKNIKNYAKLYNFLYYDFYDCFESFLIFFNKNKKNKKFPHILLYFNKKTVE